jgi:acyl-CoA synthetase (AMP-forming)/AMP-acid ligase II
VNRWTTMVDMLRQRADAQGGERAYTFLADGETESAALTWAELDERARATAALLRARGCLPGDRALLLFAPGLEFIPAFFGALYAGVIAVPAYPPHPSQVNRSLPRLRAVADDSRPAAVLTTADLLPLAAQIGAQVPSLAAATWLALGATDIAAADEWHPPAISGDSLAFLQYTSGSTATPRGVMVSHDNLLHNLAYAHWVEQNDASSVSVSWLPVIHDMGLIEGVLEPAYGGYPAFLMAPAAFLQRPSRWLRAITAYGATNSGGPDFAYQLCVRKITEEQAAGLELSSWRVAYNGAEPIRHDTLLHFQQRFGNRGMAWQSFYPVYGLAESTLLVSSGRRDDPPMMLEVDDALLRDGIVAPGNGHRRATLVASGRVDFGTSAAIVDPDTNVRAAGTRVGEIWLSSPSVTHGYWGRPDDTAECFHATIAGEGDRRWLRTGDLGFMHDDQLFVTGRLKDLIIVRGANHYPHDLELTAERAAQAIRPAGVIAVGIEQEGEEMVALAVEVEVRRAATDPQTLGAIAAALRHAIMEQHGLALACVAFLPPGALPRTTSGKLRRRATSAALADRSLHELWRWERPRAVPASAPVPAAPVTVATT